MEALRGLWRGCGLKRRGLKQRCVVLGALLLAGCGVTPVEVAVSELPPVPPAVDPEYAVTLSWVASDPYDGFLAGALSYDPGSMVESVVLEVEGAAVEVDDDLDAVVVDGLDTELQDTTDYDPADEDLVSYQTSDAVVIEEDDVITVTVVFTEAPEFVRSVAGALDGVLLIDPDSLEHDFAEYFLRGDADGDGFFNALLDAIRLLDWGFGPAAEPPCMRAADADGNDDVDALLDALLILNFAYGGGGAPPAPFPECGTQPVAVGAVPALECEMVPPCL